MTSSTNPTTFQALEHRMILQKKTRRETIKLEFDIRQPKEQNYGCTQEYLDTLESIYEEVLQPKSKKEYF